MLAGAAEAVDLAQHLVDGACASVREHGGIDANQVVAYDVAHAAAAVTTARAALEYGQRGEVEARIAAAFVADVVADLAGKVAGREAAVGGRARVGRARGGIPPGAAGSRGAGRAGRDRRAPAPR